MRLNHHFPPLYWGLHRKAESRLVNIGSNFLKQISESGVPNSQACQMSWIRTRASAFHRSLRLKTLSMWRRRHLHSNISRTFSLGWFGAFPRSSMMPGASGSFDGYEQPARPIRCGRPGPRQTRPVGSGDSETPAPNQSDCHTSHEGRAHRQSRGGLGPRHGARQLKCIEHEVHLMSI